MHLLSRGASYLVEVGDNICTGQEGRGVHRDAASVGAAGPLYAMLHTDVSAFSPVGTPWARALDLPSNIALCHGRPDHVVDTVTTPATMQNHFGKFGTPIGEGGGGGGGEHAPLTLPMVFNKNTISTP
jgi:hypothetical protein